MGAAIVKMGRPAMTKMVVRYFMATVLGSDKIVVFLSKVSWMEVFVLEKRLVCRGWHGRPSYVPFIV